MTKKITTHTSLFFFDKVVEDPGKCSREEKELIDDVGPIDFALDQTFHSALDVACPDTAKNDGEYADGGLHGDRDQLIHGLLANKNLDIDQIEKRVCRSIRGDDIKLAPGTVIADRYRITEFLAEGASGRVYKGLHTQLNINIAIKILKKKWVSRPKTRERFIREAQIMATIRHPNIVRVYDVGEFDGQVYLIMEYIEGTDLENYLRKNLQRPIPELLKLMNEVCEALSAIHDRGIIHRDIKPSNIVLTHNDKPILMDFGIAKEEMTLPIEPSNLTPMYGVFLGTPHYMAPEQFKTPKNVTKASDVYAMGVMFYQLATNELPVCGENLFEVYCRHKNQIPDPPHLLRKQLPRKISNILMTMLDKDPMRRYPDGTAVKIALRKTQRSRKALIRNWVALVIICGAFILFAIRTKKIAQKENHARLQIANSLITEGKGLGHANEWGMAKSKFAEANKLYAELSQPTFMTELAMWEAFRNSPAVLKTYTGFSSPPLCVAISTDERLGISASIDGSLILWSLMTGTQLMVFENSPDNIAKTCVAISPDSTLALSGNLQGKMGLWNVRTGKMLRSFEEQRSWIHTVEFSPDGRLAVSGNDDGTLVLWNVHSGAKVREFRGHTNGITDTRFSNDGKLIVSGSADRTVILWNRVNGDIVHTFSGHKDEVLGVAITPSSHMIASSDGKGITKFWDVDTGLLTNTLTIGESPILKTKFTSEGNSLLLSQLNSTVTHWDIAAELPTNIFAGHFESVVSLSVSPTGRFLSITSKDDSFSMYPSTQQREATAFSGHRSAVNVIGFSNDGLVAASGSASGQIVLWDIATGFPLLDLEAHQTVVTTLAFTPDNTHLLSAGLDGEIKLWDVNAQRSSHTLSGDFGPVETGDLTKDGEIVVTGHRNGRVVFWELKTGKQLYTFRFDKPINVIAFSQDGRRVLCGIKGNKLVVWKVNPFDKLCEVNANNVTTAVFLPDNNRIVTGHAEGQIKLWDLTSRHVLQEFQHSSAKIHTIDVSADGLFALTGDQFSAIKVWDLTAGHEISTLKGHTKGVTSLAFSPSGRKALSGSNDKTLRLWDFSRVPVYAEYASLLENVNVTLKKKPEDPESLRLLGEWYYFRGIWDWALSLLIDAKYNGVDGSPLMFARCYWHTGKYDLAKSEMQKARKRREAPHYYLKLCLTALDAKNELIR